MRRRAIECEPTDLRVTAANERPVASRGRYVLYWMIAARRHDVELRARSRARAAPRARAAAPRARAAARRLSVGERSASTRSCCRAWPTTRARSRARASRTCRTSSPSPARAGACSRRSRSARASSSPTSSPGSSCRAWSRRRRAARRARRAGRRQRPPCRCAPSIARSDRALVSPAAAEDRCRRTCATLPAAIRSRGVRAARAMPSCPRRRSRGRRVGAARRRRCALPLPIDHAVAPVRVSRRRARGARRARRRSSTTSSRATPTSATIPTPTPRAGCRRICTSATSRRTRSRRACGRRRWIRRARRREGHRQPRRMVGPAARRGVPRRARHVARARLRLLLSPRRLRSLRRAAGVGAARRSTSTRAIRGPSCYTRAELEAAATARSDVERGAAPAARRGPHPQLPAHAVGQEDPRVVARRRSAALATLIELNNKYAVDGRDPNSYSGILWTLGRFDRPWGPERADLRDGPLHVVDGDARGSCG